MMKGKLRMPRCLLIIFWALIVLERGDQLSAWSPRNQRKTSVPRSSPLRLHTLGNELPPIDLMPEPAKQWKFHLLEMKDLMTASELALDCFYRPRIVLSDLHKMQGFERWLWEGVMNFYEFVDKFDSLNGNYLGFRTRSGGRLSDPSFALTSNSFILAATPLESKTPPSADILGKRFFTPDGTEIAAVVEICLEYPSGRLAPPIQNPFRPLQVRPNEQPYLCNLCVSKAHRRKGLGKLLCELSEELVQMHWQKDVMYLHVEKSNAAAQALYIGMGYELVKPGLSEWEKRLEGMENILFYSKPLQRRWSEFAQNSVGAVPLIASVAGGTSSSSSQHGVGAGAGAGTGIVFADDQTAVVDEDAKLLGMSEVDVKVASNIMRSSSA